MAIKKPSKKATIKATKMNVLLTVRIASWILLIILWASILEWSSHVWVMHGMGIFGPFGKLFGLSESHIEHHSGTTMQQNSPPTFDEGGIVFEPLQMLIIYIVYTFGVLLLWRLMGFSMKKWYILAIITFFMLVAYCWFWNSFHGAYHKVNVTPKGIPFKSFNPDKASAFYKTWYKYHTLHHLSKGVSKGNFNVVVIPFADILFGTYTKRVDNRAHFRTNMPSQDRKQEQWLYAHQVFDIKVNDQAVVFYKEPGSVEWLELPDL